MYTLALPRKMRCNPTANVDLLKPFFARAGASPAPGPVSDARQEGANEVELLLNCRVGGAWRDALPGTGHMAADDEELPLEELAHCPEKEYDAAPCAVELLIRASPPRHQSRLSRGVFRLARRPVWSAVARGAAAVASLLDAASHVPAGQWALLCQTR